jgi:uncharacterized membrane protein YbhN (UPF0104 family)
MSSQRWRLAAGALLALALLALFFRGLDWKQLGAAFRSANHLLLAAVVVTTVMTYFLRAWRWGSLLAPLARVPLRDLFPATLVGFIRSARRPGSPRSSWSAWSTSSPS